MAFSKIHIEQTLHGYSNGHRLLCASKKFPDSDAKKMTIMSDLSGNEFVRGFEKYFTGYKLSDEKFVLACTWYAEEMNRPGCVWTHSLILGRDVLSVINDNIKEVLSIFRRPQLNEGFSFYEKGIEIEVRNGLDFETDKLKYLIWCIWGNKCPLVIFADDSLIYEKEILFLFLSQNDLLDEDFSFCTGSVSLRSYDTKVVQLQVVPQKLSRSSILANKINIAKDENVIKNYPMWVNEVLKNIRKDALENFKQFRNGFLNKYKKSEYFSSFIKLYVGSGADCSKANLAKLLQLATVIFDDKKEICQDIMQLYNEKFFEKWMADKEYISVLEFFIQNDWLHITDKDITHFVQKGFKYEYEKSKGLFIKATSMEGNHGIEMIFKAFANIVPVTKFVDFTGLVYENCSALITLNHCYAVTEEIWKQNKGFQQGIISCLSLERSSEELIGNIIETILKCSEYDLTLNLFKIYGSKCYSWFWKYILVERNGVKVDGIKKIVYSDIAGGIQIVKNNLDNKDTLLFIMKIINPYNKEIKNISVEELTQLYYTIKANGCTQSECEVLAKFIIPICFIADYKVPTDIAKSSFLIVHELLAKQSFPENEWEDLEKLLPELSWYNNWDRCKRLRKGLKKRGYHFKEVNEKEELPTHLL